MKLIITTLPIDQAEGFVQVLLHERMIACGNILPGATSLYWWNGAIEKTTEAVVFMESATAPDQLITRITELHPYDVPKILVIEPTHVNAPYQAWVEKETTAK